MPNKTYKKILSFLRPGKSGKTMICWLVFLLELFSFAAYLVPSFRNPAFIIILLAVAATALIRLDLAILALLFELFIGSKGYLFYFESSGTIIPLRIGMWLIVMSVWLAGFLVASFRRKKIHAEFFNKPFSRYFLILFVFAGWGLVNGFLNKNNFGDIFFDFNGWLYFALIFPLYDQIENRDFLKKLYDIFWIAAGWLTAKTYILLFFFSHNIIITPDVYRWVRTTGIGEVTKMDGGFFRIFFQSHIFLLFAFFLLLGHFIKQIKDKEIMRAGNGKIFFYFCFIGSGILISLSRSYWAGMIFGLAVFYVYLLKIKTPLKHIFLSMLLVASSLLAGFLLIVATVKFPYPRPSEGIEAGEVLAKRMIEIKGESAASSRWSLLPPLWKEIKKSPMMGRGFGSTVTYKSSDPRILESSPAGEYTTYAFEWAWLDIWLKLGILGLISYIILLARIAFENIKIRDSVVMPGLLSGLATVTVVNVFTPYLNHPLGIGCVLLISFIAMAKK